MLPIDQSTNNRSRRQQSVVIFNGNFVIATHFVGPCGGDQRYLNRLIRYIDWQLKSGQLNLMQLCDQTVVIDSVDNCVTRPLQLPIVQEGMH